MILISSKMMLGPSIAGLSCNNKVLPGGRTLASKEAGTPALRVGEHVPSSRSDKLFKVYMHVQDVRACFLCILISGLNCDSDAADGIGSSPAYQTPR
jgi:hypothetical protein